MQMNYHYQEACLVSRDGVNPDPSVVRTVLFREDGRAVPTKDSVWSVTESKPYREGVRAGSSQGRVATTLCSG